jgi:isoleucyl-tRNA synthetase
MQENVHLVWSFNIFGNEVENSVDLEDVPQEHKAAILAETLKQRLISFSKEYIRWGFHMDKLSLFSTSQSLFIQAVYDLFSILYSKQILFKEYSPKPYSIALQRYLNPNEIKISMEKVENHFILAQVINIPQDSDLNDFLEDDFEFLDNYKEQANIGTPIQTTINLIEQEENKIFEDDSTNTELVTSQKNVKLVLTVKEIFSLLFMRAVAANPHKSYCIVKHRNETYITAAETLRNQNFFKKKKLKVIRKFNGQFLAGITIANPLQSHIHCPIILDDAVSKQYSSGLSAVCPLLYQHDLHLSYKYPIDRKSVFDKYGRMVFRLGKEMSMEGSSFNL